MFANRIYLIGMYQEELALNNLQGLLCDKTQPNQTTHTHTHTYIHTHTHTHIYIYMYIYIAACIKLNFKKYMNLHIFFPITDFSFMIIKSYNETNVYIYPQLYGLHVTQSQFLPH